MRLVLLWLVVLAPACAEEHATGGDDDDGEESSAECGTLGCAAPLQLSLVATGGVFLGGSYAVVTELDDDVESCGFSLSGEASDCNDDPPCVLDNDCDAQFGFAVLPHFVVLGVRPAAELVRLGVARDNTSLVDVTLSPEYEEYFPNGSDCQPVCKTASASIDVP